MDVTLGLVFVAVFLISYYVFTKPKGLPPGPYGIPFLGNIFLLKKMRTRRSHLVFMDEAKNYGDVMSFNIGKRLFVVLTGYDAVHDALVNKAEVFSDRPVTSTLRVSDKDQTGLADEDIRGKGVIFHRYGTSWRQTRRFALQTLRDFGVGKASTEEKIFTEIEVVSKAFQEANGKPIETSLLMQKIIGNVLFGIVFGKRYDYDDPEFNRIREMMPKVVAGTGQLNTANFLPKFLTSIVNRQDADVQKLRQTTIQEMFTYILKNINEHEATFDPDNIRDFIDLYLKSKREQSEESSYIDVGNMFRVILDLFLAGSETTYGTLDWVFLYISEYPEIQEKCYREIQEVFGDKPIQYTDRDKLPYLQATLMEIQRQSPLVPLSVPHMTSKDTTFRDYNIPANTMVLPNLYSVSRDPKYWSEPDKFNPERFLDSSGKLVKQNAFMPFSTGPRICLGETLAKMELFLVFSNLLQRFSFNRETDSFRHSFEPKQFQVTNVPLSYKLRVLKRN